MVATLSSHAVSERPRPWKRIEDSNGNALERWTKEEETRAQKRKKRGHFHRGQSEHVLFSRIQTERIFESKKSISIIPTNFLNTNT